MEKSDQSQIDAEIARQTKDFLVELEIYLVQNGIVPNATVAKKMGDLRRAVGLSEIPRHHLAHCAFKRRFGCTLNEMLGVRELSAEELAELKKPKAVPC